MYDPVFSRNFHRSRAGRLAARAILMLNLGVLGWVIVEHPKGLAWGLVPLPLFVRWRRRPIDRLDAGLEETFTPPCPIPGLSLPAASPPRRDFRPPAAPPD
jgi:hypothetical protein